MNLECLNGIITDNLAIQIDLNSLKSWNLNTGLTLISINKWNGAISDDIDLIDFGLTAYDNGRVNKMYSGLTLTAYDNKFILNRVGYNSATGETKYSGYTITSFTNTSVGNYFSLNGGYLQGFFKLHDYNYELLPPRYNNGITIETIIEILPNSKGIFFLMGTRAEDKYNQYFSGETTIINKATYYDGLRIPNYKYHFSGVTTSENNFFESYDDTSIIKNSFNKPENKNVIVDKSILQVDNLKNNIIAFEITDDKKLSYKYIDKNGVLIQNYSPSILTKINWTIIDIVFTPYDKISNYDPLMYNCYPNRLGNLTFYVNGRLFWNVPNFLEWYSKPLYTKKELQLGVSFNISWGGGSFGLQNSWHYDYNQHIIYSGQNSTYINDNFFVQNNPIPTECIPNPSSDYLSGLTFSADSSTFYVKDICTDIQNPLTVMRIEYTGSTANTYFIKYNHLIEVLSNRDYSINLSIYDGGFFRSYDVNNYQVINKVSIVVYGSVDIDIVDEIIYSVSDSYIWKPLNCTFHTKENTQEQTIYIGLLIETTDSFNLNKPLYVSNFTYDGADKLSQDERKNNLFVQKYFNNSYIGNIQKLRVYDNALTSAEVMYNALAEISQNGNYNILVNKGGRLINQYISNANITQQTSGSDIRKSIKYRNADNTYRNLYDMIDILVVIKSKSNSNVELVKFKKVAGSGWIGLIYVDDYTYDFIVPNTITAAHPNEILYAEIKFQWADPNDIDNVFDKIFIINLITSTLMNNTVKNY